MTIFEIITQNLLYQTPNAHKKGELNIREEAWALNKMKKQNMGPESDWDKVRYVTLPNTAMAILY